MPSSSRPGRSLELFFVDDHPDGLLTASMFGWIGRVLVVPRTRLAEGLARTEAGFAGVYILLGEEEGRAVAYIGESDNVAQRMRNHDQRKDWWTTAILVTTDANQLNKAHVRFLEARLIAEAQRIGRTPLTNAGMASQATLSEADTAKMLAFLDNLYLALPAVRVDLFTQRARAAAPKPLGITVSTPTPGPAPERTPTTADPTASAAELTRFHLRSSKHGLEAQSVLTDGELVVQPGSQARAEWEGGESSYAQLSRELRASGVIGVQDGKGVFAEAYAFRSPSAAAAVVLGRQSNGAEAWRTDDGRTYKQWEQASLAPFQRDGLAARHALGDDVGDGSSP